MNVREIIEGATTCPCCGSPCGVYSDPEGTSSFEPLIRAAELAAMEEVVEKMREAVKEYDLWAEGADDGEFRLWDLDRLCMALVEARALLFDLDAIRGGGG